MTIFHGLGWYYPRAEVLNSKGYPKITAYVPNLLTKSVNLHSRAHCDEISFAK